MTFPKFPAAIGILLALAVQVQVTLFASDDYLGLRVNVADFIAPILCLAAVALHALGKAELPRWNVARFYLWPLGVFAVLLLSLAVGYWHFGEWSRWAVVNKIGGWVVLSMLLFCGGWVASNADEDEKRHILTTFCGFFVFFLYAQIAILIAQSFPALRSITGHNEAVKFPLTGLMANRNAFALLFLGVTAYASVFYLKDQGKSFALLTPMLYAAMPFFVLFNASRAGGLSLCLILIAIMIAYKSYWRKLARLAAFAALGGAILVAVFADKPEELWFFNKYFFNTAAHIASSPTLAPDVLSDTVENVGDRLRLAILADTFQMVKDHPILGSGLGGAMMHQAKSHGEVLNVIDSTPLWIYAETGLLGVIAFGGFFVAAGRGLLLTARADEIAAATLLLLLGFSLMCLFHEILYTRYVWFLAGMALSLRTRRDG